MHHPWKLPLAVVCLLALAFLPLLPARRGAAQAVTYTATNVGTLGGAQSTALGLDECGKVVGESNPTGSGFFHPYFWDGATMTDIGTFGGQSGGASAVNGGGRVVGYAQTATSEQRPFIWTQAAGRIDLSAAGTGAAAYDINDTNQVVGQWETSPLQDRAFVWTQATGMQIVTAPWGTPIAAFGINNAGHIVGTAQTSGGASHAFLSSGGVVTDLGTLGGTNSFAYDLNETGVVVGHANIPSSNASRPFHAFRWTSAGGMQDLGTLGGTRSIAYGVNASGQIVGYAEVSPGVNHAFLWADTNGNGAHDAGEMKDLNTLAPTAGWTYEDARAINNRGQIIVTAINGSGQRRAFLLTPDNAGPSPCAVPGALQFSAATDVVNEAGTNATITVTRTGGSDQAVSVGYATSNGTATAGADYTAASGTLNFADGETSKSFNVAVSDDTLDEADETVNLTLSGPAGGASLGTQSTAVLNITDNDSAPTISVGNVTVTEGNAGTADLVFNVTLSAASAQTVTVGYATSSLGMTATAGTDYTAASGTLTFNPGDTLKTVTVAVAGDTLDEPNETFFFNLSAPSNATFANGQAVGTITDDDGAPSLSIGDVTVIEGNEGMTATTFTVTLLPASGQFVSVNFTTANGTATGAVGAGADYISMTNGLTFNPGETSKTITVNVNGDTVGEAHETFFVNLSSPINATISDAQGLGTIQNDDTAISINDPVGSSEAPSGSASHTLTVTLSAASAQTVTVHYQTADNTAVAPGDYAATSGTLTFVPGDTSETVTVIIAHDTLDEATESFFVNLSDATNATIADAQGVGFILDNDDPPSLSAADVSVNEGNSGTTALTFNVALSAPSGQTVSVKYETFNRTAVAPDDYATVVNTLTFNPGETSKNVTVNVVGDTTPEGHEFFVLGLGDNFGATNATIADAQAQGTINNDDAAFFVDDITPPVPEGNAGSSNFTFAVHISQPSVNTVSVNWATANGTATAGSDYTAASGTITIPAGSLSASFSVPVTGDTMQEGDETFFVNLSGATNATIADAQGQATIKDDDNAPSFSVNDVTANEGDSGTTVFTFTVALSAPSGLATSVNYATADGPPALGPATAGSDYTATSGTLNFAPGDTSKSFTVNVTGDRLFENNENFRVNLSNASGATIADAQGVGTVQNDEATSVVQFSSPTYTVSESGGTATITVTRTSGTAGGVTVGGFTEGGTATITQSNNGDDYVATSFQMTFGVDETSKTFTVPIISDGRDEPDEHFFVKLNNSFGLFGATLGTPNTATVTITDDDPRPVMQFSAAAYPASENNSEVVIFLKRTGGTNGSPFSGPVSVKLTTSDGTATAGSDYTARSITVDFSEGSDTAGPIFIPIRSDTLDEADETFNLTLSDPVGGDLGSPVTAVVTIADNDAAPSLSVEDVAFPEGNAGVFVVPFVVTLSAASGQEVTVNYSTADGTAVVGGDYTASNGTLTFAPGETTKSIGVQVGGDMTNEADETFFVNLSGATNATIADAQGLGTIQNDDAPTLDFLELSFPAEESSHFVTVTVFRSGDTASPVNVDFATSDGTATERKDYTAASGTLRFAAGENTKTFDVLLTEDAFTEGVETINLTLSNPTGGAALGTQADSVILIAADDDPPPAGNPIDNSSDFVRQHYHDFLNREADAEGLAFWVGGIESCGADAACREAKRVNTSAAFFLSIEFQETGYLVYRTFKTAYGDATSLGVEGTVPVVRLNEFLPDTRRIGENVVVGRTGWEAALEANKNAYMQEFVSRQRFTDDYPTTLTPAAFVDALYANAGVTPTAAERQAAIDEFGAAATSANAAARARALRRVAEHPSLVQAELRRAFVLMQYYGYLRRNPDDAPEPGLNFGGWNFWLGKLNEFNGDPVRAEMVKAFLDSAEYRNRFGN